MLCGFASFFCEFLRRLAGVARCVSALLSLVLSLREKQQTKTPVFLTTCRNVVISVFYFSFFFFSICRKIFFSFARSPIIIFISVIVQFTLSLMLIVFFAYLLDALWNFCELFKWRRRSHRFAVSVFSVTNFFWNFHVFLAILYFVVYLSVRKAEHGYFYRYFRSPVRCCGCHAFKQRIAYLLYKNIFCSPLFVVTLVLNPTHTHRKLLIAHLAQLKMFSSNLCSCHTHTHTQINARKAFFVTRCCHIWMWTLTRTFCCRLSSSDRFRRKQEKEREQSFAAISVFMWKFRSIHASYRIFASLWQRLTSILIRFSRPLSRCQCFLLEIYVLHNLLQTIALINN